MTILMIIFAVFSFLSLIFFSVKDKEFYQSETINADPGSVLGEILIYIIDLLPWYLKKLSLMLLSLGLCILSLCYFIYE
jgi:energy-converting hydrogenase Eha subunit F